MKHIEKLYARLVKHEKLTETRMQKKK